MTQAAQKNQPSTHAHVTEEGFFHTGLRGRDSAIFDAITKEYKRQSTGIELIASENITSKAVMEAQGSVLTNKYAEGYPGKRYYGGCEFADVVEQLAIDRAKELYACDYANVQPNSGSQANQGVFTALLQPGDVILGQSLAAGGHLTHGAAPNQSGKWFKAIQYGVRQEDGLLDYEEVERLALEHKPRLIIAGFSAYPRVVDWARFRAIADKVGAWFMVDMAHISGLVAAGSYPSPLPFADVVTTTTHKTLRGPRGGMILAKNGGLVVRQTKSGADITLAQAINSAVFPGIQGGPLMHVIAGKAVAYGEALQPSFKRYGHAVIENARALAQTLVERGVDIVTGGTDNHIVLVDLRPKGLTGNIAADSMERAGLTCNKNAIPFDPQPPTITSGVRLGTPAGTTRGFGVEEFRAIGNMIGDVLDGLVANPQDNSAVEQKVLEQVRALCARFPIYDL
ncbi:MAG: serine hydroxymethyltransferase [Alphaproteobacteria bacterium]|nr:MAG: serine hydroxymethyltransferase [Alphaproteobacteria bacterium]TAF39317.1 MAG: serine hydroxymethyltransferase [Alphaproteobacteria bacterium]TAF74997.1 MAG: serine hydroxymethyltransferase [Alphaproteobacteria bacterium]